MPFLSCAPCRRRDARFCSSAFENPTFGRRGHFYKLITISSTKKTTFIRKINDCLILRAFFPVPVNPLVSQTLKSPNNNTLTLLFLPNKCKKTVSLEHNNKGALGVIWSNPTAQIGSPGAGCSGPRPGGFGRYSNSPWLETSCPTESVQVWSHPHIKRSVPPHINKDV